MNNNRASCFTVGKAIKSKKEKEREALEQKKQKEDAETAELFAEYISEFEGINIILHNNQTKMN